MSIILRNVLIVLILPLSVGVIKASHKSTQHDTETHYVNKKKKTIEQRLKYNREVLKAYDRYKKKVARVWGKEVVIPNSKISVTYRDKLKQRSVVDFEQGIVKVELAMKPNRAKYSQAIKKKLGTALKQAILQGPDERSIIEISKNLTPPLSKKSPVLAGLIVKSDGTLLRPEDIDDFSFSNLRSISSNSITGTDGMERIIVSTQFDLVPDHIRIRAERFREAVDFNAQKHKISSALIFAIIETESFFNPLARSPVPAFGLMQLVPATGARDAYRYLFAKDKVVKDRYLYDPDNNIELGVGYLHLIYFRYLKGIVDLDSRQWVMVATYNTGIRNVIRSFAGKYTKAKYSSRWSWKKHALNKINELPAEQVFKHLHKHLPYEETRNYMKKVRDRIGKYGA